MMRPFLFLSSVVAMCVPLSAAIVDSSSFSSNATLITFDDMIGGDRNLAGPSVTTQYSDLGVIFENPSYAGQVTADTNLTFGIPGSTFPNALYIAQGGHIGDPPAKPFEIFFTSAVTMVGFDYGSSDDSFLRVDVFGENNTLLDSLIYTGNPSAIGSGGFAGIQESSAIARLELSYHPTADPARTYNFSIDNLQFETAASVATPEPATFALIGIGLALLGRAAFRKRCD